MKKKVPLPHLQLELDKLKSCIHCGMCLPACPTYRVTGSEAESPRGRLYLMKKLLEGEITSAEATPHLDQCLACHGCETVCPSGVQYGSLLLQTRADLSGQNTTFPRRLKRFVFQRILPNHALLIAAGSLLRFYQQSGLQAVVRQFNLLRAFPGLAAQEQLLPPVPKRRPLHGGLSFGDTNGEHVALLIGCMMDIFYNPVHWDTIAVLVANGYYVSIPRQTCCGALAHHAGETDITRTLARQNIDTVLRGNPHWIILNSAGCGSSLKEYGHLLADDPAYADRARHFSEKVVDIMELLAKKPLAPFPMHTDKGNSRQNTDCSPEKITYHAACHLYHVQKVQSEPLALLAQVPGIQMVPLENMEACCGSAGIYNVEHPALSTEILADKMRHLQQACEVQGASTVVTGNPGCLLQLEKGVREAGLPLRVRHSISILADAYRTSR